MLKLVFKSPDTGATLGSWAYQVRAPLRVVATVPNDQRTFVALNTGIEVTFNNDDVVDPQANFSIAPAVQGRFEQHKRTLVFVPSALEPQTLYTVTVKAGLTVKGSDAKLEQPVTFQFETATAGPRPPNQQSLSFLRAVTEVATSEVPLIAVNTQDVALKTLPVQVFAYPDQKTYVADLAKLESTPSWTANAKDNYGVDTNALKLAMTVTASVEDVRAPGPNTGTFQPFIRLPEKLASGHVPDPDDLPGQDAAGVGAGHGRLELCRVVGHEDRGVDATTWRPAGRWWAPRLSWPAPPARWARRAPTARRSSTRRRPPTRRSSRRSPARALSATARARFIVTDAQGRFAVVPLTPNATRTYTGITSDYQAGSSRDYWHFMAADRPIYQPTDKINVFGVIRAREGEIKREFTLDLYVSSGEGRRVGTPMKVTTDDYGAFQATVPLEGVGSGYYAVVVKDGAGLQIDSVYVQVSQYVKPAYRIEARTSKLALIRGRGDRPRD